MHSKECTNPGDVNDWDALMQGVFLALPTSPSAQVLVNLGLVHRESEFVLYWSSWLDWMASAGWRRFGWYVWDQGPGLPGDWNGRLAPSHEFIFHFNRIAEKARKTKVSKLAGQAVGGSGLRGKDGVVSRKTNEGGVYQDRKIPDSVIRVMRHKGGLGTAGQASSAVPRGPSPRCSAPFPTLATLRSNRLVVAGPRSSLAR